MRQQSTTPARSVKRNHLGFNLATNAALSSRVSVFDTAQEEATAGDPYSADRAFRDLSRLGMATTNQITDAILQRRREHAGSHGTFSVETGTNQTLTFDTLQPLEFVTVILDDDAIITEPGRTYFRASPASAGVRRFGAFVRINYQSVPAIDRTHAWICHNGNPVRPLTMQGRKWNGEGNGFGAFLASSVHTGTAVIACDAGDEIDVRVWISTETGLGGSDTFDAGSELFAYFDSERISCQWNEVAAMSSRLEDGFSLPLLL